MCWPMSLVIDYRMDDVQVRDRLGDEVGRVQHDRVHVDVVDLTGASERSVACSERQQSGHDTAAATNSDK